MCDVCAANRHLLTKASPPEERAEERFIEAFIDVLQEWHDDILAALGTEQLPLARDRALRRALGRIFETHRESFRASYEAFYEDAAAAGRATAIQRHDLDVSDELRDALVRRLQRQARDAADAVGERMTDDVTEAIRDAFDDGLGAPAIEDALKNDVFPMMRGYEAERAARTGGTTASNRGALSSISDAGAPGKTWLATDGPRTRESHEDADNQTVPIGGTFTTGAGNSARYPGDPSLPLSDRMQCRCGLAPAWTL
ncbi:phage minor head protein [Halomarina rubra]|uniref:Phage minor head protein n=1 Tax=Halomarina rubra TaxID=2071873 RepID=A0ABD6B1A1_9EURY|nr:phage minor head protein [Halomarina rubra]